MLSFILRLSNHFDAFAFSFLLICMILKKYSSLMLNQQSRIMYVFQILYTLLLICDTVLKKSIRISFVVAVLLAKPNGHKRSLIPSCCFFS